MGPQRPPLQRHHHHDSKTKQKTNAKIFNVPAQVPKMQEQTISGPLHTRRGSRFLCKFPCKKTLNTGCVLCGHPDGKTRFHNLILTFASSSVSCVNGASTTVATLLHNDTRKTRVKQKRHPKSQMAPSTLDATREAKQIRTRKSFCNNSPVHKCCMPSNM